MTFFPPTSPEPYQFFAYRWIAQQLVDIRDIERSDEISVDSTHVYVGFGYLFGDVGFLLKVFANGNVETHTFSSEDRFPF